MFKAKLKKIQQALGRKRLDGLVLGNFGFHLYDDLLYYLLLRVPEHLVAFIPVTGKPTLYAIPFEVAEISHAYPDCRVRPLATSAATAFALLVKGKKIVGLRSSTLPANIYQSLIRIKRTRWRNFDREKEIMAIKLPSEIARLKRAAALTDQIFTRLFRHWRRFRTETDVAQFILLEIAKHGVEPSFPPIVASGAHAANPHYRPQNKKIQSGFCVLDFGVRYAGYCSDMTRTIYIGQPSAAERALYRTLLEAQTSTMSRVKAGISTAELDKFCRQSLGNRLNKQFVHGLGHGLGTQVHEWPAVTASQNVALEENMVITIEPGVYQTGKYGIRIEDDVVVTKRGVRVLTKSGKNLMSV